MNFEAFLKKSGQIQRFFRCPFRWERINPPRLPDDWLVNVQFVRCLNKTRILRPRVSGRDMCGRLGRFRHNRPGL